MKFWAFMILVVLPGYVLLSIFATKFTRRRTEGRYGSGFDRAWGEHPEWVVLALFAGLMFAILTVR